MSRHFEYVQVPESSDTDTDTDDQIDAVLARTLYGKFATHDVIGIIAATVTQHTAVPIQVGKMFDVPVLLTIATNDSLLSTHTSTLRLVPRDSMQAQAIVDWINKNCGGRNVELIYDDSKQYARDLKSKILSDHPNCNLLASVCGKNTEIGSYDLSSYRQKLDAYVIVGYSAMARELVMRQLVHSDQHIDRKILLSDGCIGPWLKDIPAGSPVFVMFPDTAHPGLEFAPSTSPIVQTPSATGHAMIGYDVFATAAYRLLAKSVSDAGDESLGKQDLFRLIRAGTNELDNGSNQLNFKFDDTGENQAGIFHPFFAHELIQH